MALPTFTIRAAEEHRDLLRAVNDRLKQDKGFASALRAFLSDDEHTDYVPRHEIMGEISRIKSATDQSFVPRDELEDRLSKIERLLAELSDN